MSGCELISSNYYALQSIYDALNGDYWLFTNKSQKWTFPSPLSSPCKIPWQGVTCGSKISDPKSCFVTDLEIPSMNLTGTLPSNVSSLSNLELLDMHENSIYGVLPSISWGKLSSLNILYLFSNSLSGSLPEAWSTLSSLEVLYLYYNKLSGTLPTSWSALDKMNYLALFGNYLDGSLPQSWSHMSSIATLSLYDNFFVDNVPTSWSALSNLQFLYLSNNHLSGFVPEQWRFMNSTLEFSLSTNMLSGPLPNTWSSLTKMEFMMIENNHFTGTLPDAWSTLERMRSFAPASNNLDGHLPPSWSKMTQIEALFLESNSLSGALPESWSSMKSLQYFAGYSNRISSTLPSTWGIMDKLQVMSISTNRITGSFPPSWSGMKNLQSLYLADLALTGSLPVEMSSMLSLTDVYFINNSLVGSLPEAWSTLTKLQTLFVSTNPLTGPFPNEWSSLRDLVQLSLFNCSFTGTLPSAWSTMTDVEFVSFYSNQLTGTLPTSWNTMTKLGGCYAYGNMITGTLPNSWSSMKDMITLFLYENHFSGTLPESWSTMNRIQLLIVFSNSLSGSLPTSWGNMPDLAVYMTSLNELYGVIPTSYGGMRNVIEFSLEYNILSGNIPTSLCSWSVLQFLVLLGNQFSGDFNLCWPTLAIALVDNNNFHSLSNISARSLPNLVQLNASTNNIDQNMDLIWPLFLLPGMKVIDISSNSINGHFGNIPLDLQSAMTTIDASNNCISTKIDKSICLLSNLTTFIGNNIYNSHSCSSKSLATDAPGMQPYPSCLLLMKNIETLSLVGNGYSGSLVDIPFDSKLSFLALVSNRITGTLPLSFQQYGGFDQLLLSFNKISGVWDKSFKVRPEMTNLNMTFNRLSGTLPPAFQDLSSMDVVDGNIVSCASRYIFVSNDYNADSYACGSIELAVVGYLAAIFVGVFIIALLVFNRDILVHLRYLKVALISSYHRYTMVFWTMIATSVSMLILILILSAQSSSKMFVHEYGWVSTTSYKHGSSSIAILTFVTIAIIGLLFSACFIQVSGVFLCLCRYSSSTVYSDSTSSQSVVDTKPNSTFDWRSFVELILFHAINFAVIGGLTVLYIYTVLVQAETNIQIVFTLFLSFFKVFWASFYISRVFYAPILRNYANGIESTNLLAPSSMPNIHATLLSHEIVADIWCFVLCPLVSILGTSGDCYQYLIFFGVPSVEVTFPTYLPSTELIIYGIALNLSNPSTSYSATITEVASFRSETTYPPFLYSYQCSSTVIQAYVAIVYYTYLLYCIVIPMITLLTISFQNSKYQFVSRSCIFLTKLFKLLLINLDLDSQESEESKLDNVKRLISIECNRVTATRHRLRARFYITFLIFGLAAPPLGLLIAAAFLVDDALYGWQVSQLRSVIVTKLNVSESVAEGLCECLLLQNVSNVYHEYLPWASLIVIGYWSLFGFDAIGDVFGTRNGLITFFVYMIFNLLFVMLVYCFVEHIQKNNFVRSSDFGIQNATLLSVSEGQLKRPILQDASNSSLSTSKKGKSVSFVTSPVSSTFSQTFHHESEL